MDTETLIGFIISVVMFIVTAIFSTKTKGKGAMEVWCEIHPTIWLLMIVIILIWG